MRHFIPKLMGNWCFAKSRIKRALAGGGFKLFIFQVVLFIGLDCSENSGKQCVQSVNITYTVRGGES